MVLRILLGPTHTSFTGLSPSLVQLSRSVQVAIMGLKVVLLHHISLALLQGIQFDLICVRSQLLTESQLISFPAGTKMFSFPAFVYLTASR